MTLSSLAIPLGFILLAAVLCWQLISGLWRWWMKLVLIICVPAYGLAVWASIPSYQGWPTEGAVPKKALLHAVLVHEPDAQKDDPGAIYVWVSPLEGALPNLNPLAYDPGTNVPRAYRLPYSKATHQRAQQAIVALQKGSGPMVIESTGKEGGGFGQGEGEGENEGAGPHGDGEGSQNPRRRRADPNGEEGGFRFYPLPSTSGTGKND